MTRIAISVLSAVLLARCGQSVPEAPRYQIAIAPSGKVYRLNASDIELLEIIVENTVAAQIFPPVSKSAIRTI